MPALTFWNRPMVMYGSGSVSVWLLPLPFTSIVRQVSFFIPSAGSTQGPPVLLHPGAEAMPASMPNESARWMA